MGKAGKIGCQRGRDRIPQHRHHAQFPNRAQSSLILPDLVIFHAPSPAIMGFSAPFAASCGKSSQVPVHEPFAHPAALSQSCPVKLGQTWLNHFLTWTNLDREQPSSHVRFGIKSGSPETFGLQATRKFLSAMASATVAAEVREPKPPHHPITPLRFVPTFSLQPSAFSLCSTTPSLHSAASRSPARLTFPPARLHCLRHGGII